GSAQTRLTKNSSDDRTPAWSPDGKQIVFRSKRVGNWEIYLMNADGTGEKDISNNPADDSFPDWQP
ncbi:MAG: PD40 domain-containing protein, partial [Chloroflexi bacterium]|nr:PD40 domain-containing protein [Chloroflexota bacterium]